MSLIASNRILYGWMDTSWPPTQPHAPVSILHGWLGSQHDKSPQQGANAFSAARSSGPTPWRHAKAFNLLWVNEWNHSRTRCCSCRQSMIRQGLPSSSFYSTTGCKQNIYNELSYNYWTVIVPVRRQASSCFNTNSASYLKPNHSTSGS